MTVFPFPTVTCCPSIVIVGIEKKSQVEGRRSQVQCRRAIVEGRGSTEFATSFSSKGALSLQIDVFALRPSTCDLRLSTRAFRPATFDLRPATSVNSCTLPIENVTFKFITKLGNKTLHGKRCGVSQRTDGVSQNVAGQAKKIVQVLPDALPFENAP